MKDQVTSSERMLVAINLKYHSYVDPKELVLLREVVMSASKSVDVIKPVEVLSFTYFVRDLNAPNVLPVKHRVTIEPGVAKLRQLVSSDANAVMIYGARVQRCGDESYAHHDMSLHLEDKDAVKLLGRVKPRRTTQTVPLPWFK